MLVGIHGTGTLNVLNGGVVSNTSGYVGYLSGSTGTATVDGAGSQWNSTSLDVGGNGSIAEGNASLTVSNSGAVSVTNALQIWSTGTVNANSGGSEQLQAGSINITGEPFERRRRRHIQPDLDDGRDRDAFERHARQQYHGAKRQ